MYVQPQARLAAQVSALIAAMAPLAPGKVHLYKNDFTPVPTSVLADFTEVTATGYSAQTVVWGTVAINDAGFAEVLTGLMSYAFTDGDTNPFTCFGYYMTDTAGTTLLMGERFSDPVTVNRANQPLDLIARFVLGQ